MVEVTPSEWNKVLLLLHLVATFSGGADEHVGSGACGSGGLLDSSASSSFWFGVMAWCCSGVAAVCRGAPGGSRKEKGGCHSQGMWLVGEGSDCLLRGGLPACSDPEWMLLGAWLRPMFYLDLDPASWSWWLLRLKNAFWLGAHPPHGFFWLTLDLSDEVIAGISDCLQVARKTKIPMVCVVFFLFLRGLCANWWLQWHCLYPFCTFVCVLIVVLFSDSYE